MGSELLKNQAPGEVRQEKVKPNEPCPVDLEKNTKNVVH
ncbi:MAG: hypothetical protein Ct9H300mP23_06470 [Nitrospinota bacterium]|nr:MAG: hypothetical protein Ct9H300mP23_06470 [Nitrospinota bacterium]